MNPLSKRVYIAYTGGTIGMKKAAAGYVPAAGYLQKQMKRLPELKSSKMPAYEIREYDPLQDSSNMTPEVCLCFGSKLLRGNRAIKVDADGFEAFASPNFPALGSVGIEIKINRDLVLPPAQVSGPVVVRPMRGSRVAVLRLFPGISADIVRNVLQPPIKGLVLETYGIGNGPQDPDLISALKTASELGLVIINCTQCIKGSVNMEDYATGSALAEAGVISGFDMTVEAALAKMAYLFSRNLRPEDVKNKMQLDMRGELSGPP